jgi:pimeloyl-[acyl-carrier protein] methyl ester esterase
MTGVVLLHGWGLSPELWRGWLSAFEGRPVLVPSCGFTGPCAPLPLPENPGGWIGVGHSHGFARLLVTPADWRGLVGFGAFLRFCRQPGRENGTEPETIDAMLARLYTDPADVLARFARRCGLPKRNDGAPADVSALAAGLRELRALDLTPPRKLPRILLVHATDDRIVAPALAAEAADRMPGAALSLFDKGGHALPFTRQAECIALVQEFLHGLG